MKSAEGNPLCAQLVEKPRFHCRLRDGACITYERVSSARATLGFAKPRLFEQAVIPFPNKVC
jgi:hypothetical protein